MDKSPTYLISLPPAVAASFLQRERKSPSEWFATCDPPGLKLGSGGGVIQTLLDGANAEGQNFEHWVEKKKRLVLLAGGQSRRLPAYAVSGKILMPMPVVRSEHGQRLDQTLLDVQAEEYKRVLNASGPSARVLVASGDVFLRLPKVLPKMPDADIVGLGMSVSPAVASDFGVFFCRKESPSEIEMFLQKPEANRIRELAEEHLFFVDTGLWLLSQRAINFLAEQCGPDQTGAPQRAYELYSELGLKLGKKSIQTHGLTSAVVPLIDSHFFHFGTTRQLIASMADIQNLDSNSLWQVSRKPHPEMFVLNSDFLFESRSERNRAIWIENSSLPPDFKLEKENVITGLPRGDWSFYLAPGQCLDVLPIGESQWAVRPYGFDDAFKGRISAVETLWLGQPALEWFKRRALEVPAGDPDLQAAPIFAVVEQLDSAWISWLIDSSPVPDPVMRERWEKATKLSANQLGEHANLERLYFQRRQIAVAASVQIWKNRSSNPFYRLDLECVAELFAESGAAIETPKAAGDPLKGTHEAMFMAAVARQRGEERFSESLEMAAFSELSEAIVSGVERVPAIPRSTLLEDQIVWARSPIRLDLAGGWSDTPPFCLKHGGSVLNVAVDLNGQPPIQVFVRGASHSAIVLRSIDLGAETRVTTLEQLTEFTSVGAEFSLAKGALSLAGFHPRFSGGDCRDLKSILQRFGGGLEISMLAATPKGSGLGTSSILAATLFGALSESAGLGWDREEIARRTLALEQLLTTGGGWQDQIGGLYEGIKLIETQPGLEQLPTIRWLPDYLLGPEQANRTVFLYYTGITRVAKTILKEIVRGMFLNTNRHLTQLFAIRDNSRMAYDAILRGSRPDLCRTIRESWRLNQALDSGTNPPEVANLVERIAPHAAGLKLLGAGGGGYLLIFARDEEAGVAIRRELESNPSNPRARFVKFQVSQTGLQVTRS